jgi:methyltransferase (TIGR00027 family)
MDGSINHVSDTALMVAACRAIETERPDRFVADPFARRLAGERGMAIVRDLPRKEVMEFGIAVRSRFIDDLLMKCIAEHGVRTVVSFGCGLDARPWRLELPPELSWIEVDFADILAYKEEALASVTPKCKLRRMAADITDPEQRKAAYSAVSDAPGLMITEGLLTYLPADTLRALAAEPAAAGGIRFWIADLTSPVFSHAVGMWRYGQIRAVEADDHLNGEEIRDAILSAGWETAEAKRYVADLAALAGPRLKEMAAARPQNEPRPNISPDDFTGAHLLRRSQP